MQNGYARRSWGQASPEAIFERKFLFLNNVQFFLILFSKVRGSVRFLGGSVGSRFDFKEQIRGSVGSRFDFWRFGRFEVRYFKVRPNTSHKDDKIVQIKFFPIRLCTIPRALSRFCLK